MNYLLPKTLTICDKEYEIRSDFRAILDAIAALNDADLTDEEKIRAMLIIIYVDYKSLPDIEQAVKQAYWFIGGGEEQKDSSSKPRLMDWEQDFSLLISPINRIIGCECRSLDYLHWWTFLSAYMEIGECAFSNVISIRSKKAKGKKLEKWEQEFYRDNSSLIDLKKSLSSEEQAEIDEILGGE